MSEDAKPFQWDEYAKSRLNLPDKTGYNLGAICLDNHPPERTALTWLGADGSREVYTFGELARLSNQFASVLTTLGIKAGDRIFIFLERVPELYIALYGALKAQVIVGPLFSAFGPEAIRDRLQDSGARLVLTSPDLKPRVDRIQPVCPDLERVIVLDTRTAYEQPLASYETLWTELMEAASDSFAIAETPFDAGSIIHYTSGTTGKPKGVLHRHGSVIAQAATAEQVLDLKPDDVYWCTADPGWVTGTSYGMIGPWALGVSQLVYEGGFSADGWYKLLQDEGVTVWYTAPTAIRMLMKAGDDLPKRYDLSKLRHLCSVGEPLNPEALHWGERVLGMPFHDTWWQTETGAMHIVNRPGLAIKSGSMGKPFPGVEAGILSDEFEPLPVGEEGHLALRPEAPSFFKTYWNRDDVYQSRFKNGWYITGDRARQDEDGYFWFVGRADDVINTAGHLVGPFEVESALVEHPAVAEAGVIGVPDDERMEVIKAFVSLREGYTPSESLENEIRQFVRQRLAAHAYPRQFAFVNGLPKTRSGKIMRRLLKARELGLPEGDLSTLED